MSLKSYKKVDFEPFYLGAAGATLSADGSVMATAVMEDIVVIDRTENAILHRFKGDSSDVTTLQLSPDGRFLAVLAQSQQLRVFNIELGSLVKATKLSAACYISAVDPTSSLFSFGLTDGSVIVWDIAGSYITHNLKGHGGTVSSLAFYGEAGSTKWKLASGDIMGTVKIWDLVKRKCIKTMNEHTSAVRGLNFNSDGTRLVTGSRDNTAIVYNTKGWKEIVTIPVESNVESAGFLGQYLYTAGEGCVLKVWDLSTESLWCETKKPLETTEEIMISEIISLAENPGTLVAVLSDQTIQDIDLRGLNERVLSITRNMAGNHGTIADIRYVGPDRNLMALATNSPALRVVDLLEKPFDMDIYTGHTDLLNMVDSTVDGMWLATASKDHTAKLWKYMDGGFVCYATFEGHGGSVTAVGLPRTPIMEYPRFIVTASEDLTIKKWKVPKPTGITQTVKTSEYTRRAHDKVIHALDVSPNNDYLATASHDKTAKIWDLATGETVGVLRGSKRAVYDVTFCAYDRVVATGSGDQTAKVWSLDDFTCKHTMEGHANAVQRVSFIEKGKYIVGAGSDGLIKIWEVSSGECIKTLDNHDNRIWALRTKDDGAEFVSADADGSITIWQDNTTEAREAAEEERKQKVEQEQELSNYIKDGEWVAAFELALKLDHPMRLYRVVTSCIGANEDPESVLGSFELEELVAHLDEDRMKLLFKRIRDWNTNQRTFSVAQKLIRVVLTKADPETVSSIQGVMNYIDAIVPYSERHYTRYDNLVEQSYILDYVVKQM